MGLNRAVTGHDQRRFRYRLIISLVVLACLAFVLLGDNDSQVTTPSSSTIGQWSTAEDWPVLPIHASVTSTGELLTFGADAPPETATGFGDKHYDIWEADNGEHTTTFQDSHDYFCALTLNVPGTGDLLIAGGDDFVAGSTGVTLSSVYSPTTGQVNAIPPMQTARWYPTGTVLANGEIVVQGGTIGDGVHAITPEIYNTASGWRSLTGATSSEIYGYSSDDEFRWWYPRAWVDPNGDVFGIAQSMMYTLDPTGNGALTTHGLLPVGYRGGGTSSAVMYEPFKILQVGGGGQTNVGGSNGLKSAAIIDISSGTPVVTPIGDMAYPRQWANATVLPNGQVLVNGGSDINNQLSGVAFPSELWDPATQAWTVLDSETEERLYHASSVLLPDGRVFSGGGGSPGPVANLNAQFFTPPYLFDAAGGPAARPDITWSPPDLAYGNNFGLTVGAGQSIARVTLVKAGATTHSFNADQRFVEVGFTQNGDQLTVTAPSSATVATPGYYLLSVIQPDGVVSESAMVSLLNGTGPGDVLQPPTDTEPPVVAISEPADGSFQAIPVTNLGGSVSDNVAVSTVEVRVEDRTPGQAVTHWDGSQWVGARTWLSATVNGGSWSLPVALPSGHYRLLVKAGDGASNTSDPVISSFQVGDPTIDSPAPGSTLTASAVTFSWQGSANVGEYQLEVGPTQGSDSYFDSPNLGSATSVFVDGLPTDGSDIWVRLRYRVVGGTWQDVDHQYSAVAEPVTMTTPSPNSTLGGSSQTFSWATSIPVDQYWLRIGASQGASDYYAKGQGSSTSEAVTTLPTDGSTVWVRLFHQTGVGPWLYIDYQYTAAVPAGAIDAPVPGATLVGPNENFSWSGTADEYQLLAGPTQGTSSYYDSGNLGTATSTTATGLPTDGSTVWVRLRFRGAGGSWQHVDEQYTALDEAVTLYQPAPGTTFTGSTATFAWITSTQVDQYWMRIGASQGASDYYAKNQATNTSVTVNTLPTDGSTVWVRLFHQTGIGPWLYTDYQYTAVDQPAALTTPAPGTNLTTTNPTFTWTGTADEYQLLAGPTQGTNNYYDSGNLGIATSTTATGLPTDGSTIWITLQHRQGTNPWQNINYQYTALNQPVTLTTPTPDTTFTGPTATFAWTTSTQVDQYWMRIGASQGASDYYAKGQATNTTTTVNTLPTDGSTVWVRLFHQTGIGPWLYTDYQYTAVNQPAALTTPAPGTNLTTTNPTFTWTGTADEYQLLAGPTQGTNNYYDSGNLGIATSTTATGLPTDGSTVWITLQHRQGTNPWQNINYQYTALNQPVTLTTPTPDTTFTGPTATFTWTTTTQIDQYWMRIGATQGASDYYAKNQATNTSVTVNTLPTDGSTVWVRLFHRRGANPWQYTDHQFTAAGGS